MVVLRGSNHKLEVQENSRERHEVEPDRAESNSPNFVNESTNLDFEWSSFHWVVFSMDGDRKFLVFALRDERRISERVEVNSWNSSDRCKRNVSYNYLKHIWETRQNDHDVDLNNNCDECAQNTYSERHVRVAKLLVVVDGVFHQDNAHLDILFNVDVHHHGGYESSNHHKEVVRWSNQIPFFQCVVIVLQLKFPNTTNHANLDKLDNQSILEDVRFLFSREIHAKHCFIDKDSIP